MRKYTLALALAMGLAGTMSAVSDANAQQQRGSGPFMPVFTLQPSHDWQGMYFGGSVGYGMGDKSTFNFLDTSNNSSAGSIGSVSPDGFIGGLQLGRNWQTRQFVYGFEADANLSGIQERLKPNYSNTALSNANIKNSVEAFGSFRGRAGVAYRNMLFYGTTGLGTAKVKSQGTVDNNGTTVTFNEDSWKMSLVAGAGIEYALPNNITLRGEYQYHWIDGYNITGRGGSLRTKNNPSFSTLRVGVNVPF